jgi:tRNA pseudouridine38-40 synthase
MTLKLILEYEGSGFSGWQIQPDARTVQGELERCLGPLLKGKPYKLIGASRTDSGVHAKGQTASLHLSESLNSGLRDFQRSLNGMLAPDVFVKDVEEMPGGFHARYSAKSKTYTYRILTGRSPLRRAFTWQVPWSLDPEVLKVCSELLLGFHDFAALAVNVKGGEGEVTVEESRWEPLDDELRFVVRANRFVYMMIRSLVGLMTRIALGKMDVPVLQRALEGERPKIFVAPPQGLTLMRVHYE